MSAVNDVGSVEVSLWCPSNLSTSSEPPISNFADGLIPLCRAQIVKCSRTFPRCTHCTTRRESCSLASWKSEGESVEKGKVQSSNTSKRKLREFPSFLSDSQPSRLPLHSTYS